MVAHQSSNTPPSVGPGPLPSTLDWAGGGCSSGVGGGPGGGGSGPSSHSGPSSWGTSESASLPSVPPPMFPAGAGGGASPPRGGGGGAGGDPGGGGGGPEPFSVPNFPALPPIFIQNNMDMQALGSILENRSDARGFLKMRQDAKFPRLKGIQVPHLVQWSPIIPAGWLMGFRLPLCPPPPWSLPKSHWTLPLRCTTVPVPVPMSRTVSSPWSLSKLVVSLAPVDLNCLLLLLSSSTQPPWSTSSPRLKTSNWLCRATKRPVHSSSIGSSC
jgi:hypothetical protein